MQINKKIQELNKQLPHGSKKMIAKTTGLDIRTVVKFFKLRPVTIESQQKIVSASKDILESISNQLSL